MFTLLSAINLCFYNGFLFVVRYVEISRFRDVEGSFLAFQRVTNQKSHKVSTFFSTAQEKRRKSSKYFHFFAFSRNCERFSLKFPPNPTPSIANRLAQIRRKTSPNAAKPHFCNYHSFVFAELNPTRLMRWRCITMI